MENPNLAPGYWIIAQLPGRVPWLLNMGAPSATMDRAERTIAGQRRVVDCAVKECEFTVTRYDSLRCVFVDEEGMIWTPDRGPYTAVAWDDFLMKMATTAGKL